jgi:hypothetical protein
MTAEIVSLDRVRQERQGTEPWLSKTDLADHYSFSTRWVELRVRDGMPARRIGGRLRFRVSETDAWLEERQTA